LLEGEVIETTKEIVPLTGDVLVSIAENAERRIDAMAKIKALALKMTNVHDWTDQGGKPYLQVSGSEKVARLFGISWRVSEPVYQQEENGHFTYTYKGEFSLGGATIEAIGVRSSKDGFFKKYTYNGNERVELPTSEIDKGDVKKAAYTNCLGNGITRILGLRNLTWDDLSASKITQEAVKGAGKGVQYKKEGKSQPQAPSGDSPKSEEGKAPMSGAVTPAQINAIFALLNQAAITDKKAQLDKVTFLAGIPADKPALTEISVNSLTKAQASDVISALKAGK
jgi:hypothetical protein